MAWFSRGALLVVVVTSSASWASASKPSPSHSVCGPVYGNHPTWSPDGKRILFAKRDGSFWTIKPDGSGAKRLTPAGQKYGSYPVFSPDGSKIAFDDTRGNVALIRLRPRNLTPVVVAEQGQQPAWSPDGSQLALETHPQRIGDGLEVVHADGSNPQTIATNVLPGDADPAWAPDGQTISFNGSTFSNLYAIQLVHPDGSGLHSLDSGSDRGQPSRDGVDANWSPNGRTLAYARVMQYYRPTGLHLVKPDGSGDRQLTHNVFHEVPHKGPAGRDDFAPRWSPNGKWILFMTGPDESWYGRDFGRLWLIKPNEHGRHPLCGRPVVPGARG